MERIINNMIKKIKTIYGSFIIDDNSVYSEHIKEEYDDDDTEFDIAKTAAFNAQIGALESILLALHMEGIDILDSKICGAVETTMDAIVNHST